MSSHVLSPDTKAILLLCSNLGRSRLQTERHLNLREYNLLARWLRRQDLRPGDLLRTDDEIREQLRKIQEPGIDPERLMALLERGLPMALALERWTNQGGWVLSRFEEDYPPILKERLKSLSPPLLYGVGNKALLSKGGLAVLGSREVEEAGIIFTREIAALCGRQKIQVISGGARGVDRLAMEAALGAGGTVIGVLANNLGKAALANDCRPYLLAEKLVLLSPYDPEAHFSIGNAMGRNKLMYALSNWGLVVSASLEKGGTWAGATENLKHCWAPLFVRNQDRVPEGNRRLLELGGISLPADIVTEDLDLNHWFTEQSAPRISTSSTMVDNIIKINDNQGGKAQTSDIEVGQSLIAAKTDLSAIEGDDFGVVWPHLEDKLHTPQTPQDLANIFNVQPKQIKDWLMQAIQLGKVEKLSKPVRYVIVKNLTLPY